ncbi:MAG: hypothetical protein HN712_01380 [Gemmatimonadetes bacterium]|jgi:hypothetical protein|nr:hypothetical protein [Gemmatimonadota bacterium]MBT6144305.1 hypothetical protein [Gemmatimonadota bacterium]MBT7858924.1 hypothetical protein [Gemmatimonadota bacterium]
MSASPISSTGERAAAWRAPLAITVAGWLLFETLTGLLILFLPFGLTPQFTVIIHTGLGCIFLLPYVVYQIQHWSAYRDAGWTHVKLTGYVALGAMVLCIISGLVLTVQAIAGTRISYVWDLLHTVATFALLAAVAPHVVVLMMRVWGADLLAPLIHAQRRWIAGCLGFTALGLVAVAACVAIYEPPVMVNEFPDDYDLSYGEDRPFAPSLAKTSSGGAYDPRSLAGSLSCGTSGCHEEIVAEWEVSAHRYASMDPAFQKVQEVMAQQNGPASTRYCGGCHDPISLFSGTKNLFTPHLTELRGYQEGISCIACHSIQETDVQGNANYTLMQPERYAFEVAVQEGGGNGARFLRDFLIRSYPWQHTESLSHRLFKSPEFCAACHKQFIDAEINQVGWVQLQNQYDNWRKSRWNHPGDPSETIECRECHMPLMAQSREPAAGDDADYNRTPTDERHRSHRFLGANQFIPTLLDLPGAAEHVALTEAWMRGDFEIPEIADKWSAGPAIPIELVMPEFVHPDEEVSLSVRITNNKAGHDFPTGPLDIIQAWVELEVTDENGEIVYQSGIVDEDRFIEPGSFIFKAEAVDQYGNLIDRHNLWEMVGVRFKRSLFPGFADQAEYTFSCPGTVLPSDLSEEDLLKPIESFALVTPGEGEMLHVKAALKYRKIDQYLLNFLMGEETTLTAPITVLSTAAGTIAVREREGPKVRLRFDSADAGE